MGDNTAYLVTDEPGNFFSYDLSQGTGGSYGAFANPWTITSLNAGAAFVPEPGSLSLLGMIILSLSHQGRFSVRRRHRRLFHNCR